MKNKIYVLKAETTVFSSSNSCYEHVLKWMDTSFMGLLKNYFRTIINMKKDVIVSVCVRLKKLTSFHDKNTQTGLS